MEERPSSQVQQDPRVTSEQDFMGPIFSQITFSLTKRKVLKIFEVKYFNY